MGKRKQGEEDSDDGSSVVENHVNGEETHDDSKSRTSSYSLHTEHKLTEEEIEMLKRRTRKYRRIETGIGEWAESGEPSPCSDHPYQTLKKSLRKHMESIPTSNSTKQQEAFFSLCSTYKDILHHAKKPFYLKGADEDSAIMNAYLLHSLNHVLTAKRAVTKNDKKLKKKMNELNKAKAKEEEEEEEDEECRDQGFTRPKVLILVPLASIALRVVKKLIELTPPSHKNCIDNADRFLTDFTVDGEDIERKSVKPSDHAFLFGGNNDDHFMIGVKFARRNVMLYSDFYTSDLIVASPLALVTKIGDIDKDTDYLSSIEILVVDHADVIAMQNWSHVATIVGCVNSLPSKLRPTMDITRIRRWYMDGHAGFYRQTIVLSAHASPDINAFFNNRCTSFRGSLRPIRTHRGVLSRVDSRVRQVYERFDDADLADGARLAYFKEKVFPKIADGSGGTLLFVASYFEFVRIRNFLKSEQERVSFCLLGDYTEQSDISRARLWFFEGKRKVMIYTERAHFYHRYRIRGIRNLIVYSLPERKEFYPEIVNMLDVVQGGGIASCIVLFSRFDVLRLERVVGTASAKRMLASDQRVFVFY